MNICRVFPTFQVDFKYTEHYLAKEFCAKGHKTTFVTSDKYLRSWKSYLETTDGSGYRQYDNFDVYRLKAFFPYEKVIFKNWVQLYHILFKSNFNVIHLLGLGTFTTFIVLFLSLFITGTRPVIMISDHTDPRTHARTGFMANLYYLQFQILYYLFRNRIAVIISFSEVGVAVLSHRYGIDKRKFRIIPLGYDSDDYRYLPEEKNTEGKFVIGFAGKIDEKKRVDVLLKAVSKCRMKDDIRLIIIGIKDERSYDSYLKKLAADYQLDIEFRPFASSAALADFYNYINLAVYPGGISITTIEANGCGTPVIIYRSISNLENRVENGRGKLFSTEKELVEQIEGYYEQYRKDAIDYTAIAGSTAAASSWKVINGQYLETYNLKNNHV